MRHDVGKEIYMKKQILVGADPLGRTLKDEVVRYLEEMEYEVVDVGSTACRDVDYYQVGDEVGKRISTKQFSRAIIFCGTGMGVNIVANKHRGVYCGLCESVMSARLCRVINNCNVLSLGALLLTPYKAIEMVKAFLETPFYEGFELCDPSFLQEAFSKIEDIEKRLYDDCSTQ